MCPIGPFPAAHCRETMSPSQSQLFHNDIHPRVESSEMPLGTVQLQLYIVEMY